MFGGGLMQLVAYESSTNTTTFNYKHKRKPKLTR